MEAWESSQDQCVVAMVLCRLVSGAAGTSSTPLYRTRGERRHLGSSHSLTFQPWRASYAVNSSYKPFAPLAFQAITNYCPFGLPIISLINSSYVRGSKAIRYRPSSNHKRCQLAICRRFLCRLGRKLPGNQSIWVPGEVWLQS